MLIRVAVVISFVAAARGATASPVSSDLPFPEHHFSYAAAATQNTYCGVPYNKPGQKIKDIELLETHGDQINVQRASIYYGEEIGIVVGIGGTNDSAIASAFRDIEASLVPPSDALQLSHGALIDLGWKQGFDQLWADVRDGISRARAAHAGARLIIAGHSQGSALATLIGLAYENLHSGSVSEILGFGPPRVGNGKFAAQFDAKLKGRYTGIVNGHDSIGDLPRGFTYKHVSGLVWINPSNSTSYHFYAEGDDSAWLDAYRPQEIFFTPGTFPPQSYRDDHRGHYMHSQIDGDLAIREGPCPGDPFIF